MAGEHRCPECGSVISGPLGPCSPCGWDLRHAESAEIARLRAEVERLTREHAEFLRTHNFDAFERLRAARDAALRERDEAARDQADSMRRLTDIYAANKLLCANLDRAHTERDDLAARLREAERLLRDVDLTDFDICVEPHRGAWAKRRAAFLAASGAGNEGEGA